MKNTLRNRLYSYLKRNPGFHAKGNLADMARDSDLRATGEATGRRLRELQEDGLLEVQIRGKHAWYRYIPNPTPKQASTGQITPNKGYLQCGARGVELNADHIEPFAKNPGRRLDLANGRTLCVPCHEKTPSYKGNYHKNYANS